MTDVGPSVGITVAVLLALTGPLPTFGQDAAPKDVVSFSAVIAPLLAEHCTGCHGAERPRAGLSMANYQRLAAGGDGGPVFISAKPSESLIVAKLLGTADGARMPLDRPALTLQQIGQVEKWIAAGAKYDAADPAQPLEQVVAIALAGTLPHEELSARRALLARQDWRLALPEVMPTTIETNSLRLWGNVQTAVLERIGEMAEAEGKRIARLLRAPKNAALVKGKLTLFVFNHRYEYAEFGLMVEGRELPAGQMGHWRHNTLDAYACLAYSPESEETTLPALLTRQLAGAYLASYASVPNWFAEGCARAITVHYHPKDPEARSWRPRVRSALESLKKTEAFFTAQSFEGAYAVIAYGFAQHLMSDSRRFQRLLKDLRGGDQFDRSFARAYGAMPDVVFSAWVKRAAAERY